MSTTTNIILAISTYTFAISGIILAGLALYFVIRQMVLPGLAMVVGAYREGFKTDPQLALIMLVGSVFLLSLISILVLNPALIQGIVKPIYFT